MDYASACRVRPGAKISLDAIDPRGGVLCGGHHASKKQMADCLDRMRDLQYLLYAEGGRALLVVLHGLDAAGKDGAIRHVFSGLNPQGTWVTSFKQPSAEEAAHDFLWRIHRATPARGEIAIFNRSHYEDVLVARVHNLVPTEIWRARYARINDFESLLAENGTRILKFFLHISPEEQLNRFQKRLEDPMRQWKISEADYTERRSWDTYGAVYHEALSRISTDHAPWLVVPSDHKWRRNLLVAGIIAETLEAMELRAPPPRVDLDDIRGRFHAAERSAHGK